MAVNARDQYGQAIPAETRVVQVTAEHIAEGERCHCYKCPVALAVAPLFPGRVAVVTCSDVFVYDTDNPDTEIRDGSVIGGIVEEYWEHDAEGFIEAFDGEGEQSVQPRDVNMRLLQRYV